MLCFPCLTPVPTAGPEGNLESVFIAEFGKPPEAIYREFDYNAIGSASIGQVHKAMLADGALRYAVKVQQARVQRDFSCATCF